MGPLLYADIENPQSLNKYAYVMNNPLRYVDPNGHCVSGTIDTLICLAGGVAVVKIITDLYEFKNSLDETKIYVDYYNMLLQHAEDVCSKGGPECQAALEAAQRARLATPRKGAKAAAQASTFPGTFVGGPLPTSREDLAASTIQNLITPQLRGEPEFLVPVPDSKTKKAETNGDDPKKKQQQQPPRTICLMDRNGNCVE